VARFTSISLCSPRMAFEDPFWPARIILLFAESRRAPGIHLGGTTPGALGTSFAVVGFLTFLRYCLFAVA